MTDTLITQVPPGQEDSEMDDCGCCIRPPSAMADELAGLVARRDGVERRLRGLTRS